MPVPFKVCGPYEVPVERLPGGRSIHAETVAAFWNGRPELAESRGCYIFAMRAGSGIVPGYVGKACKSFAQECFTNDKIAKYLRFAARYARGTPVMFLVTAPNGRGRPNERAIEECEGHLIALAIRVSPHLVNVQGTSAPASLIPHITGESRGRPSTATRSLMRALDLHEPTERVKPEEGPEASTAAEPEVSAALVAVQGTAS